MSTQTGTVLGSRESDVSPGLTSDMYTSLGPIGMERLCDPPDSTLDIIFVHGLTGNRHSTWKHQNNTVWPRDLLPTCITNARIWSSGYDADVINIRSMVGGNGLLDHGKSLAHAVAGLRSTPEEQSKPIIFVAHSLGGLVCEQALLVCSKAGSAMPSLFSILEATRGIVFMGTPHQGSRLASWGYTIAKDLKKVRGVNRNIVKTLEVDSEVLRGVEEEFQKLLLNPIYFSKIKVFCFYEEKQVWPVGFIVPKDSAILPQYLNASIYANYMDMTKFSSANDAGYMAVSSLLRDWVKEINTIAKTCNETPVQNISSIPGNSTINGGIHAKSDGGPQFISSNVSGNTISWSTK